MRVLIAVGATLAVAVFVGVAVLAVWPVVADAPWESEPVTPVQADPRPRTLTECEKLREQLAAAQTEYAAKVITADMRFANCLVR